MPYTPSGFFCDRLIRERERRDGEGSLNKPIRFNSQDYSVLRQECVHRKSLFEDDTFPATVESLGYKELGHKSNKVKNIAWKRPKVGGGTLGMQRTWGRRNVRFLMSHNIKPAWKTDSCCRISPGEGEDMKRCSRNPTWMAWNVSVLQYKWILTLSSQTEAVVKPRNQTECIAEIVVCFYVQEICDNPQFIVGGASRTDICQGDLGKASLSYYSITLSGKNPPGITRMVFFCFFIQFNNDIWYFKVRTSHQANLVSVWGCDRYPPTPHPPARPTLPYYMASACLRIFCLFFWKRIQPAALPIVQFRLQIKGSRGTKVLADTGPQFPVKKHGPSSLHPRHTFATPALVQGDHFTFTGVKMANTYL